MRASHIPAHLIRNDATALFNANAAFVAYDRESFATVSMRRSRLVLEEKPASPRCTLNDAGPNSSMCPNPLMTSLLVHKTRSLSANVIRTNDATPTDISSRLQIGALSLEVAGTHRMQIGLNLAARASCEHVEQALVATPVFLCYRHSISRLSAAPTNHAESRIDSNSHGYSHRFSCIRLKIGDALIMGLKWMDYDAFS